MDMNTDHILETLKIKQETFYCPILDCKKLKTECLKLLVEKILFLVFITLDNIKIY